MLSHRFFSSSSFRLRCLQQAFSLFSLELQATVIVGSVTSVGGPLQSAAAVHIQNSRFQALLSYWKKVVKSRFLAFGFPFGFPSERFSERISVRFLGRLYVFVG